MKSPNYTTYVSDGYGRDSYILENNGGLTIPRIQNFSQRTKFLDCSTSKGINKLNSSFVQPKTGLAKSPTRVHYPPDGTGRDWYIVRDNHFTPKNTSFESTLRSPNHSSMWRRKKNYVDITDTLNWVSKKSKAHRKSLSIYQMKLAKKLSSPKNMKLRAERLKVRERMNNSVIGIKGESRFNNDYDIATPSSIPSSIPQLGSMKGPKYTNLLKLKEKLKKGSYQNIVDNGDLSSFRIKRGKNSSILE
eukprot:CAMPEP_0197004556 /NCGR_PEP_ID=MMETSP1380-20130617/23367_1 /TAXON_ID=5936 /ORGANISM="Euplotes crassus, Strain CT5" /LENGTH=246 /DNA_ID=CAMNT_0042423385 /DNA_START=1 /DNA_END=738 /DNA_ORIENTATION=+